MFTSILSLSFFLLLHHLRSATAQPYNATDYFLLNCGSPTNTISFDRRVWDADTHSKFTPPNTPTISSTKTPSFQDPAVNDPVPYMTSRIFNSSFTYTFPVSPGPKFLRLYFYRANYSNSFFNVTTNGYSLLSNFSAFLTISSLTPSSPTLIKEFIITVKTTQRLAVTFTPSPNSYAFINGIEVVSVPDNFYVSDKEPKFGLMSTYPIRDNTAFEKVVRLNVGGGDISGIGDTGMYRPWSQDDEYIYGAAVGFTPNRIVPLVFSAAVPNYTAPELVYTTSRTMGNNGLKFNLTWIFPVDSGFYYLLRLHFCEIQLEVTRENERVFTIFINNQTAEEEIDVIYRGGGVGHPVFQDYVVYILPDSRRGKQDLWLAMQPNTRSSPVYADALLNGLEIFKLNGSDGSLAAPNPDPIPTPPPPGGTLRPNRGGKSAPFAAIIGGVVGGIAILSILVFTVLRRRKRVRSSGGGDEKSLWDMHTTESRSTKTSASTLPSDRCRQFSLEEIKSGTGDFDDNFVIGTGGFGKVYKGYLENAAITVAIKRLNPSSSQGAHEFQTEIGLLSKLRHLHLVSLIGYCDDNGEMILVYDYMDHGTLREHLYRSDNPPLSWKRRLEICIGAARGLHYLHTGAKRTIIHRDVKSTNILLDEKWVAKVADFGLSRLGPKDGSQNHVSTIVKGSFGYVDPEYYRRQQLTDKSDVYSFGVVLFEVLCARPVVIPGLPQEQVNLAEWAKFCCRRGNLDRIVDPKIKGEIALESLKKFCEVAESCLRENGTERPAMNDVVWNLEFALELQEAAEKISGINDLGNPELPFLMNGEATTTDDDLFSGSAEHVSQMWKSSRTSVTTGSTSDGFKSETVFSEIVNQIGR